MIVNHLDTLRKIVTAAAETGPRASIDPDIRREAGMDGNLASLLQAARRLDAPPVDPGPAYLVHAEPARGGFRPGVLLPAVLLGTYHAGWMIETLLDAVTLELRRATEGRRVFDRKTIRSILEDIREYGKPCRVTFWVHEEQVSVDFGRDEIPGGFAVSVDEVRLIRLADSTAEDEEMTLGDILRDNDPGSYLADPDICAIYTWVERAITDEEHGVLTTGGGAAPAAHWVLLDE